MYTPAAIEVLMNRIGFGKDDGLSVNVLTEHKTGTSGRIFSSFHKLVTLMNLYETVEEINVSEKDFNEFLRQMKHDAVKSSLVAVLNQNCLYLDDFDYSDTIVLKSDLLEEVVGYTLAIMAIEQMVSTNRKNDKQRNASLSYQKLKMELEGITDEKGFVRARGINKKLRDAIKRSQCVMFPNKPTIHNANIW